MGDGGKTRIGTGSAGTIYTGHFVVQTVTEHLKKRRDGAHRRDHG
jgi:hypothetical protein